MKKLLSIMLSALMLACVFVPGVSADEEPKIFAGQTTAVGVSYRGEQYFVKNEFYKLYADEYFEEYYKEYIDTNSFTTINQLGAYILFYNSASVAKSYEKYISDVKNSNGIYYSSVIFNYDSDFSEERNKSLAESLGNDIEVLYVGKTTPCAVVGVKCGTDDIDNIIENPDVAFISPAFDYLGIWVSLNESLLDETFEPTAADARRILRYSAGLDTSFESRSEAKRFFFMSDTDYDNKITSADARTALRISAGLEKGHTFFRGNSGQGGFWML